MKGKQPGKPVSGHPASMHQAKEAVQSAPFGLQIASLPRLTPYLPGILLFLAAFIIGLVNYKDYGISWDEPAQRALGELNYNYIFNDSQELFTSRDVNYGAGFELLLTFFEKGLGLTDPRDIYLSRHVITHIFFLTSLLAAYVLIFRLFKNRFIACLGFLMLLLAPRLYAHSFFNSKDIPFMSMFMVTMACFQIAFEKSKTVLFFLLGLLCGFTTSIRIMGVMLFVFILLFLLTDLITSLRNKEPLKKPATDILVFSLGFCSLLFVSWPLLWTAPIHNFLESFSKFSSYGLYNGCNLLNGKFTPASAISWSYFPTWFLITNPELWLISGLAGLVLIVFNFFKRPLSFLTNTPDRNFLFHLLCFSTPIAAVLALHSVIYDDWRHLYFVYPSFVLMALYFINALLHTKYGQIVKGACILQLLLIGFFMVSSHPFHQVYFNNFVSHEKEHLHKNYEMDYWGLSYMQGLKHLLETEKSDIIKVTSNYRSLVEHNIMMLPESERRRIQYTSPKDADYLITNFRDHPYDYPPYQVAYSVSVCNSTVMAVFRMGADLTVRKKMLLQEIANLKKAASLYPDNGNTETMLGDLYLFSSENDSAEGYYNAAIVKDPHAISTIYALADLYFSQKKYPQSISVNKKALSINPNNVLTYANTGLCYLFMGQHDSAIYYSNRAIAVEPRFPGSYEILASAYKAIGNSDSLRKYAEIARINNPRFTP